MDLTKLYKKQISFTEWFEAIGHDKLEQMRMEDYDKRERLRKLSDVITIPFDRPTQFPAIELKERSEKLKKFVNEHGEEHCALRLNPLSKDLSKHRLRGPKIKDILEWFDSLDIDATKYNADFVPHANEYVWSTIFVVTKNGIFGEIIKGGHYQLTQGFYKEDKPIFFSFDFSKWSCSDENALSHLKGIMKYLNITDTQTQEKLKEDFNATSTHNYLNGYFETVFSNDMGLWFVDYNRILGEMYEDFTLPKVGSEGLATGMSASPGITKGKVRIISTPADEFEQGDILVTSMTTPDFVPLMQKAGGIVTDLGGVLSHAAIVSRELKVPCIVGTGNATTVLKEGEQVEVDANNGVVRRI